MISISSVRSSIRNASRNHILFLQPTETLHGSRTIFQTVGIYQPGNGTNGGKGGNLKYIS